MAPPKQELRSGYGCNFNCVYVVGKWVRFGWRRVRARAYICVRSVVLWDQSSSFPAQKYLHSSSIRFFPKQLRASRRTRGKDFGSLSAATRAGRVPKWLSKAFDVFSLMLGIHISWRDQTVSLSRFLLLVGFGGLKPEGMPGGGLPAFPESAMTIAAVSSTSTLLITCELGRNSAFSKAPSNDLYGKSGHLRSPSTIKKMRVYTA